MQPTMEPAVKTKSKPQGNTWLGVGAKSGGQLLFGGVEGEAGILFNLDNPSMMRRYSITSSRWGLGLGGGGGITVTCVFNSNELYWLSETEVSDWGVNISMGAKWKDVVWFIADKKIHLILKMILRNPFQFLTKLDNLRDFSHFLYNTFEVKNSKTEHPILSLEIPMSGPGLELSGFVKRGKIWIDP
jgi:hypothetical protein